MQIEPSENFEYWIICEKDDSPLGSQISQVFYPLG